MYKVRMLSQRVHIGERPLHSDGPEGEGQFLYQYRKGVMVWLFMQKIVNLVAIVFDL